MITGNRPSGCAPEARRALCLSFKVIGNAFKNNTDQIRKTELIVFIKPRIVRNVKKARDVSDEFRRQLDFSSDIKKRRGGSTKLEQDAKKNPAFLEEKALLDALLGR